MNQAKRFLRRLSVLRRPPVLKAALPFAIGALSILACSQTETAQLVSDPGHALSDAPDGDFSTTMANTVVNTYAQLTANAAVNATTVTVDATQLAAMGLKAGDLIMVMQPQGAQIMTTDDNTYGTLMDPSGAGRYEFIGVKGVNTTTGVITVDALCNGLKNAYSTTGNSQVLRVPQYAELKVNPAHSLVPVLWNGTTGGVLAVRARHVTVAANASMIATGMGFRGGLAAKAGSSATDTPTFISTTNSDGGGKGEGIAGYFPTRFARGAVANGGGGGNSFGAGGGGGGNGGSATGWKGNGVQSLRNANDATAWALDPEAVANANTRTTEGGGGRGGYSQANATADVSALTTAPADAAWGGNLRRERGGRGGQPVPNNAATQIFFGGGGGAGAPTMDALTGASRGIGGRGGGLIYVLAGTVDGDGSLTANGRQGADILASDTDGPGGGGAGGTIVVNATTLVGNLSLQATGGAGGTQYDATVPVLFLEAEGPGGGGGGGFIAVPAATPASVQQSAAGGLSGITQSALLSEFPTNGASQGKAGLTGQPLTQGQTPICAPLDLRISVTDGLSTDRQGTRITYRVTVYNDGPFTAVAAPVTSTVTPSLSNIDWTCSTGVVSDGGEKASCSSSQGTGDLDVAVTLPAGASATMLVRVPIPAMTTGNLKFQAKVEIPPGVNDGNLDNNTATDTTAVGPDADLRMSATVAPEMTKSGQPLTYILGVSNGGPNAADNVVVTFDIPLQATVIGAPIGDGWSCSIAEGLMTCLRPNLARGAAPDITLTVQPEFSAAFATGSARVTSDSADPDMSNNGATAVANITYDPTGFSKASLAGGGIGCSQAPRGVSSPFGLYAALLATALLLRRRARRVH